MQEKSSEFGGGEVETELLRWTVGGDPGIQQQWLLQGQGSKLTGLPFECCSECLIFLSSAPFCDLYGLTFPPGPGVRQYSPTKNINLLVTHPDCFLLNYFDKYSYEMGSMFWNV